MITFENGIDIRAREAVKPTVARFHVSSGNYEYCVIGTDYGHIHTSGGNVRTWGSYSGAYKHARDYQHTANGLYPAE